MTLRTCLLLAFAALSLPTLAAPLEDPLAKLLDEGKNRNQAYTHLLHLTRKIGPRLTGSPESTRAEDWAIAQFKKWGLTAWKEQWGSMPVGFTRGPRQVAKMVLPFERSLVFSTPAWTPGTQGPTRGAAILEPATLAEFEANPAQFKGKWLIMRTATTMRGPATLDPNNPEHAPGIELAKRLDTAGILGRVYSAGDDRVHTHGRFMGLDWNNLPTQRIISIRRSDMFWIRNGLSNGKPVELEFDIENRFIQGPVPLYNVIADLKGTEKPDEMVIVCGHLDSWNGPGSQGANDNGTGVCVAMEAARLLSQNGFKPKRTIRFILWTGEEQGLLGARHYVHKHLDEMDKVSAVFNDDGGTNYQGGYSALEAMAPMLREAIAPTQRTFPELPMEVRVIPQMPTGGSSDHAPFNWVGVPGFFTMERGRADYGFIWHTQNDRPEHSIPEYMAQSSTNHAVVSLFLANAPTLLPRGPKPQPGSVPSLIPPVGGIRVYFDPHHDHAFGPDGEKTCIHDDDFWMYIEDVAKAVAPRVLRVRG